MIYVTGDIHSGLDMKKIMLERFDYSGFTKDDYLIICGDFGVIWNYKGMDDRERYLLDMFENMPWTTLFIDGNHECFPRLYKEFPIVDFHGGKAHKLNDSVYHLMRGQVFTLQGKTFFTFGGASSHDKAFRTEGETWWPEELPSSAEMMEGIKNLEKYDNKVDYVITHSLPTSKQKQLHRPGFKQNRLTDYFEELDKKLTYTKWFSGHYHMDGAVDDHTAVIFYIVFKLF